MLTPDFNPFPQLETERLLLRSISEEDAAELFALRSDPAIMQYLDRPLAQTLEDALVLVRKIQDSLQANQGITWAITQKNDPRLRGTIGFWQIMPEHHRAEIGYLLDTSLQGKGIMQEALRTVLDYGFATMKLHSVEANVNPANAASVRLLERNGFTREAYFRENYFYNGRFLDTAIYSLLTPFT